MQKFYHTGKEISTCKLSNRKRLLDNISRAALIFMLSGGRVHALQKSCHFQGIELLKLSFGQWGQYLNLNTVTAEECLQRSMLLL